MPIISFLRILLFFIWINLNPRHSRMICAKFGWNWPNGSGGEDFYIFVNVFSLFCNNLPLQKGGALHLNKLESPTLKDALCQVWLKNFWWRWKCENYKIYVHKHKNNSHNEMSELPNLNLTRHLRLIQFYNPLYWTMMGREWWSFTMLCLIAIFVIRRLTYCRIIIVHGGSMFVDLVGYCYPHLRPNECKTKYRIIILCNTTNRFTTKLCPNKSAKFW